MCKKDEKNITEKLENEIPYRAYSSRLELSFLVFFTFVRLFLIILILWFVCIGKGKSFGSEGVIFLIILSLITICSFIFFGIVLFKDDQGIKFAKLNELARISEKLETISEASKTNITMQSTANKGQKCFLKRKACKNCKTNCEIELINYKYELYKKYMDTLVDI